MTHTVHDEQTSPSGRRVPTLPAPPRFESTTEPPTLADSIFRSSHGSAEAPTAVIPTPSAPAPTAVLPIPEPSAEERQLAAERAARREAREAALAAPDARAVVTPEPVIVTRRSTDRFLGSFSLFLLRLAVAAIMAVRGLEIVMNPVAAQQLFATTIIPEPAIMATVTGFAALAIAVALVFGLLTRLAGLGVTLITGGALAFVLWGNWSPFVPGRSGFVGEFELLLAAVGLLLLCVGGGGFSLDRSFRKSREKNRLVDPTA
ncbi:MAG: DoxX family protein [Micropruina sp.]|uniref:DoxX family protein n=1 Tax=Micropruina sp. TaxID=2737536 RepID=UPI0039E47888